MFELRLLAPEKFLQKTLYRFSAQIMSLEIMLRKEAKKENDR